MQSMLLLNSSSRVIRSWVEPVCRWHRIFLVGAGLAGTALLPAAEGRGEKARSGADFMPAIELAPFVVNGERLSVSILARSKSDRRYAEKFAEEVIEVVYETLENANLGAGLVIIGEKGEPHPIFVFRKFVELARGGALEPHVAAQADGLSKTLQAWEARVRIDGGDEMELDFDAIVNAMPLPLEGVGSKLYQLAWAENFDETRVEQRLRSLTAAELAGDELSRFDWVFYLPPRDAFRGVLKSVLPALLKKGQAGFFKRAALRSALVVFAPAVKKAMEALRKGMLFMTVLRARSSYNEDDVMALTGAYTRVLMPDFKFNGATTQQRAIDAIAAQKVANAEYAKDPFVSPKRLQVFDPAAYDSFSGEYAEERETTHRFARSTEGFTWQYLDRVPSRFYPAGERLFVNEKGDMTIEFLVNEAGEVTGVEERWVRRRKTVPRKTFVPGA